MRWTLLVLIWAWVLVTCLVLDLFFNIEEFDHVRPDARVYRGARYAAHKMVGEEYVDGDFPAARRDSLPPLSGVAGAHRSASAERLARELDAVREMERTRALDDLREVAVTARDPRVRVSALTALVGLEGAGARDLVRDRVLESSEMRGVRAKAAMLVGRTGEGALGVLEEILHSQLPDEIRAGAVLGLKELRSYAATERLLGIAAGTDSGLTSAALRAVARSSSAEAAPLLVETARDPTRAEELRLAACEGLGIGKLPETVAPLVQVLSDASHPPAVRAAAAKALGRIGRREALEAVTAACADASPAVVREARIARSRLSHVKTEQVAGDEGQGDEGEK